jgi:molybdenum cofactor synthesis domain-containing protein
MSVYAEILAIGNELLIGDVLDTNSHWLCRQLTGLGATVRRVCQVPDERDTIRTELLGARARGAQLLITTGGLGPTEDDLTLEAAASACGLALAEHPLALRWVADTYTRLAARGIVPHGDMTAARAKMARLPLGAAPLANGVGSAPGVLVRLAGCCLVCLPGVPEELKDIFQGSLQPTLAALLGQGAFSEWRAVVRCNDESILAPLLSAVSAAHPTVYVKSRARRLGTDLDFNITLSSRAATLALVMAQLEAARAALVETMEAAQIQVLSLEKVR